MLGLLAIPASAERAYLDPAFTSISCWQHEAGRWTLVTFNDVHHLDGLSESVSRGGQPRQSHSHQ